MAYLEPGAYLKFKDMTPLAGAGAPAQVPLIVGRGKEIFTTTEVIVKGDANIDTLPDLAWESIDFVGSTDKVADFTVTTDYTFDKVSKTITWVEDGTSPLAGDNYVIKGTISAGDEQFKLYTVTSSNYQELYGTDVNDDGTLNEFSACIKAALLSGAPRVHALQIKANGGVITGTDYTAALEEHAGDVASVWRIVPVDTTTDVFAAIEAHISVFSSYEERMERTGFFGKSTEALTAADVITEIGGFAEGKGNSRLNVVYPSKATWRCDDGISREVGANVLAAACAGLEASMPGFKSKTRSSISVFESLLGPKMKRTDKNALAEKGVFILEQPNGAGTPAIVRHQLTTNMSSVATKESSIVAIRDHAAKSFRNAAEQYIGKYNITADTITRVKGTLNSVIAGLESEGWILPGSILEQVVQDANNPDTLLVSIKVKVPYPCNYIKITVIL